MKINIRKFVRAAVVAVILTAVISILAAYAIVRLTGHEIVKKDTLKEKDARISQNEKIFEMQDIIKKDFFFTDDRVKSMDAMAKALADSLDDRYSEYMTEQEVKEWEKAVNSGFTGIGITANVIDGRAEILSVAEEGPADAAGLKEGDVIRTVNEKEFETEAEFLKAISGSPGKTLKLGMLRGWYTFDANVTIGEVEMRSVESRVLSRNVGYIRITSFGKDSAEEFSVELKSLLAKEVKGLVIDLRGNGGGYVDQGIKICDMLLPECTMGYLESKNGKKKTFNSDEESCDLPMTVLVNEKTASASEIVAAAIQGNKAGTIVGQKTYGKGLSQTEYKFKDGSALKITTAQYLSPSGDPIDGTGVVPDVKVKQGDDGDRQLKKAAALIN